MDDFFVLDVYRTFKNTYRQLKNELREKLSDKGVTWPQFHALYHIGDEGISTHELAVELHCNVSNMTGLIDRMIENGWVYRESSEKDRRVRMIKLTDEGLALKNKLLPEHTKNIRERMSALNQEELAELKRLLVKLSEGG